MKDLVRAEIDIDAPIEHVWEILFDIDSYSDWNPFTPRVESTLELDDPVHLYVRLKGEHLTHRVEYVSAVEPPNRVCWRMKIATPLLLAAERCQILTPLGEGRTHYVTEDHFRGLLTPLVMSQFRSGMQRGFDDVATALKQRAEAS
jgi:hypothetical protein